jgi:hypothetical protein
MALLFIARKLSNAQKSWKNSMSSSSRMCGAALGVVELVDQLAPTGYFSNQPAVPVFCVEESHKETKHALYNCSMVILHQQGT